MFPILHHAKRRFCPQLHIFHKHWKQVFRKKFTGSLVTDAHEVFCNQSCSYAKSSLQESGNLSPPPPIRCYVRPKEKIFPYNFWTPKYWKIAVSRPELKIMHFEKLLSIQQFSNLNYVEVFSYFLLSPSFKNLKCRKLSAALIFYWEAKKDNILKMQFLYKRIAKELLFQNFLNFQSVKLQHKTLENTGISFKQLKIFFQYIHTSFSS